MNEYRGLSVEQVAVWSALVLEFDMLPVFVCSEQTERIAYLEIFGTKDGRIATEKVSYQELRAAPPERAEMIVQRAAQLVIDELDSPVPWQAPIFRNARFNSGRVTWE